MPNSIGEALVWLIVLIIVIILINWLLSLRNKL